MCLRHCTHTYSVTTRSRAGHQIHGAKFIPRGNLGGEGHPPSVELAPNVAHATPGKQFLIKLVACPIDDRQPATVQAQIVQTIRCCNASYFAHIPQEPCDWIALLVELELLSFQWLNHGKRRVGQTLDQADMKPKITSRDEPSRATSVLLA